LRVNKTAARIERMAADNSICRARPETAQKG
jgi:hypothetical protein